MGKNKKLKFYTKKNVVFIGCCYVYWVFEATIIHYIFFRQLSTGNFDNVNLIEYTVK